MQYALQLRLTWKAMKNTQPSWPVSAAFAKPEAREFPAFTSGAEERGIDIQSVQEIRSHEESTHTADAPGFILRAIGVVHARMLVLMIEKLMTGQKKGPVEAAGMG